MEKSKTIKLHYIYDETKGISLLELTKSLEAVQKLIDIACSNGIQDFINSNGQTPPQSI